MRTAIVNTATGLVENVIELEEGAAWTPPGGHQAVADDAASVGWAYAGGTFTPPPGPEASPQEQAAALAAEARTALAASDVTVLRCVETAAPLPAAWASYRAALRAIAAGKQAGPLPDRPAYPKGS